MASIVDNLVLAPRISEPSSALSRTLSTDVNEIKKKENAPELIADPMFVLGDTIPPSDDEIDIMLELMMVR